MGFLDNMYNSVARGPLDRAKMLQQYPTLQEYMKANVFEPPAGWYDPVTGAPIMVEDKRTAVDVLMGKGPSVSPEVTTLSKPKSFNDLRAKAKK